MYWIERPLIGSKISDDVLRGKYEHSYIECHVCQCQKRQINLAFLTTHYVSESMLFQILI